MVFMMIARLSALVFTLMSADPGLCSDPRVSWLKENAIPVASLISTSDDSFADLEKFGDRIGQSRVVMLGEATHGDGATFAAKVRLVKYLHEKLGFEAVAFESGMFDLWKVQALLKSGEDPAVAFPRGLFGIYGLAGEMAPLFRFMAANDMAGLGFDVRFSGGASRQHLVADLKAFLKEQGLDGGLLLHNIFYVILQNIVNEDYSSLRKPPLTANQRSFFLDGLKEIRRRIAGARHNSIESPYWLGVLDSIKDNAEFHFEPMGDLSNPTDPRNLSLMRIRDRGMAQNLLWHLNQNPQRKVVVWAASWHTMRNQTYLEEMGPMQTEIMGDIVWKSLRDQMYSLAFTAFSGQYGHPMWGSHFQTIVENQIPDKDELEEIFARTGFQNAIVDLRSSHWSIGSGDLSISDHLVIVLKKQNGPRCLMVFSFTKLCIRCRL